MSARLSLVPLAGLARLDVQLRSRTSASGSVARSFGESTLRLSRMRGMRMFLLNDGRVNLVPCRSEIAYNCRDMRGRLVAPRVYIDELLVHGLEQLDTYEPAELYKVDVFDCAPGDRLGGWEVRVYTYDWVERQTKRPRQLIPTCFAF